MGFIDEFLTNLQMASALEYRTMQDSIRYWMTFISFILETEGTIDTSKYEKDLEELYKTAEYANKLAQKRSFFRNDNAVKFYALNDEFQRRIKEFERNTALHNAGLKIEDISKVKEYLGEIEGHQLDNQQLMAIAIDAHNHNVVAGAGTGKTTTIIGKVKYLIQSGKYQPDDILVLSYTRAAAQEMNERLRRNLKVKVHVSTIHRFGYSVLTAAENKKPRIYSDSPREIVKKKLAELMKDKEYSNQLLINIACRNTGNRSDIDPLFTSMEDYLQYVSEHEPVTLMGEKVKSYGELHVANILTLRGIKYVYEEPYEHDTATMEYAQYRPDFYLPEYKIYIEFFGVDRSGNAPAWFKGDNPRQTYRQGIVWKRDVHRKYGTKLIECYAYEDAEGILEQELERKLTEAGVTLKEISIDELFKKSDFPLRNALNSFITSASSVISLARNRKVSSEELKTRANTDYFTKEAATLINPLYRAYEEYLENTKQIDFADMLHKATDYIKEGKYKNPFPMIIVDEYQDLTASQFHFLKALRESADFDLFCVGDDWQSIYRFNGSDVSYIMDFEQYWGDSVLSRIETTYRFSDSLIEISGNFIMKNSRQIKKSMCSPVKNSKCAVSRIEGYRREDAILFMAERILYLPKGSTVFLLGRYTFDIELLRCDSRFLIKYDTTKQTVQISLRDRPDLRISYHTAHGSKGLQADYVYILNNRNGILGFPSKVEDSPLTELLVEKAEQYPFAEERRLFYVAMTRAKKHVYLLTEKGKESVFVKELIDEYYAPMIRNESYFCPKCGGQLKVIDGKYGKFFGCTNYRVTGCNYKLSIKKKEK